MNVVTYIDADIDADLPEGTNLYATPHAAIIAAEQRVAEACAKLCEKEAVQIVIDGPEERAYNNAVSDCSEAIRSGEWRKYL